MRCTLLLVALLLAGLAHGRAADKVDFKRDVQPILEQRCVECHGADKQKSGVRVDRKSGVFGIGDSGQPAVIAGKSADSLLFQRVTTTDDDEIMPPKGEKLTAAQVDLLRRWIDEGASWPEDPGAVEKKHWAYEMPVRRKVPEGGSVNSESVISRSVISKEADRTRPVTGSLNADSRRTDFRFNPIDSFIGARLEKEGLKFSPAADRATLLRRVSLDLIGLPPSLEEIEAFLADPSPDAYEKVVNRLLRSPQFGERWARPWLDGARYADTQGYEKDNRRVMWPYRDWVINAFNQDMPFDQFTIEQLAGDLLPEATQEQKVATGFHRNTMTNTEGGTDDEEFRYEAVIDRVNTTWAVWMGSTFNCAQCHNHKYDPFTAREYYQFMAFLNSTADADKDDDQPAIKVFKPGQETHLAGLRRTLKEAEAKFNEAAARPEIARAREDWELQSLVALTNWQVLDPTKFVSLGRATLTRTESKSIHATGTNPTNDTYLVITPASGRLTGIRLEVLESGAAKTLGRHTNGGFVLRSFEVSVQSNGVAHPLPFKKATADFSQKDFDIANVLSGKGDGWAVATFEEKNRVRRSAYFTLEAPIDLGTDATLLFVVRHSDRHPFANLERFRLYGTTSEQVGSPASLPDDVRTILLTEVGKRDDKQRARLKEHFESVAPGLKEVREARASARKAEKEFFDSIPVTLVLEELKKPRETHRHIRGAYLTKGEAVAPGTPATLHDFPSAYPSNRLGMARWIVSTNNPLTARVMVNRLWEQVFGLGIVETVEEFGSQGEPPTHPELLDWLAWEFIDPSVKREPNGTLQESNTGTAAPSDFTSPRFNESHPWSIKTLLKTIVLSHTYRQSSRVTPELLARDPSNRLLARGPRVRLDGEMIRDQALAVSGLLSRKMGGPSVMPPQPDGLWQVVYSGDKWITSKGEDKYRRGVYTFWRRSMPHPMMVSFDAPSREFCVLKRSRSNTPLQSLNLLNDPAFIECAQVLARAIASHPDRNVRARLEWAFRTCLARHPSTDEMVRLARLYEQQLANFRADRKAAEQMGTSEIGKGSGDLDVAELAAWTVVANILLNLDEMITKG